MTYLHSIFKPKDLALTLAVDQVISSRRTRKVLGHLHHPASIPHGFTEQVEQAIKIAGWAPFHYPAHREHRNHTLDSIVPWRFYALDQTMCLTLAEQLLAQHIGNTHENSGIIRMLSAAGAMVMCTWLPEPDANPQALHWNDEHLAAASAAIQNLLLASEARNIQTYWSSGGALNTPECFRLCGIPTTQRFLGAIFMFPPTLEVAETHDGKLRNQRGTPDSWRTWVTIQPAH